MVSCNLVLVKGSREDGEGQKGVRVGVGVGDRDGGLGLDYQGFIQNEDDPYVHYFLNHNYNQSQSDNVHTSSESNSSSSSSSIYTSKIETAKIPGTTLERNHNHNKKGSQDIGDKVGTDTRELCFSVKAAYILPVLQYKYCNMDSLTSVICALSCNGIRNGNDSNSNNGSSNNNDDDDNNNVDDSNNNNNNNNNNKSNKDSDNINEINGLIITSKRALYAIAECLKHINTNANNDKDKDDSLRLYKTPIYVVGPACHKIATGLGFTNVYGKDWYVHVLNSNIQNVLLFVYLNVFII